MLQSSRDKDKIRRIRAEIAEQHESMMELISECGIRFKGLPRDLYTALTETNCLPLEEGLGHERVERVDTVCTPSVGESLWRTGCGLM